MKKYLFLIISIVLFFSCEDKKNNSDELNNSGGLNVKVINLTQDAISVAIGPSDYGTIIPNDTTDYMSVNTGDNEIYLNTELFLVESFSTSITGDCQQYYTYRFIEGGGYSYNWENELTDWDTCM